MKKLLMLLVVLILVGTVSWAQAQTDTPETGQWLHDLWISYQKLSNGAFDSTPRSNRDFRAAMVGVFSVTVYHGFVMGMAQVMWVADWIDLKGITQEQQNAVVGKYLDDHPEQWNLPAGVLVYRALHAVWPGKVAAPYQ
jgi:hypothetical protein